MTRETQRLQYCSYVVNSPSNTSSPDGWSPRRARNGQQFGTGCSDSPHSRDWTWSILLQPPIGRYQVGKKDWYPNKHHGHVNVIWNGRWDIAKLSDFFEFGPSGSINAFAQNPITVYCWNIPPNCFCKLDSLADRALPGKTCKIAFLQAVKRTFFKEKIRLVLSASKLKSSQKTGFTTGLVAGCKDALVDVGTGNGCMVSPLCAAIRAHDAELVRFLVTECKVDTLPLCFHFKQIHIRDLAITSCAAIIVLFIYFLTRKEGSTIAWGCPHSRHLCALWNITWLKFLDIENLFKNR